MSNIRYTNAQRLKALEVFDRTQSVTKTVRKLVLAPVGLSGDFYGIVAQFCF